MGPVEKGIRVVVCEGDELATPSDSRPFWVGPISNQGIELQLGAKRTPSFFAWPCLEGIVPYLRSRGPCRINGLGKDREIVPGTLDGYLKGHIDKLTAGWVAVLLEKAGIIVIDRTRPATVRLAP